MSLDRFFTKTVTSQRKASSTGNAVEVWANVSTSVKCCIPPTTPSDAVAFSSMNLRFNVTHQMFCWATEDIKVDDKIVDGSDEYIVRLQPKKWGTFYQIYLSEVA
jgi:hypothetical protein